MCGPYPSACRQHGQKGTSNQTSTGQGPASGETVSQIICCHRTVAGTMWTHSHQRLKPDGPVLF